MAVIAIITLLRQTLKSHQAEVVKEYLLIRLPSGQSQLLEVHFLANLYPLLVGGTRIRSRFQISVDGLQVMLHFNPT